MVETILNWFLGLAPAAQATVIAGLVSAVVSLTVGFFNPFAQARVEKYKTKLQKDFEQFKVGLQPELERVKVEAQTALEDRKIQLQTELETRKAFLTRELEQTKTDLSEAVATRNARRAYEFDAIKRLYTQVEPLLFQLFEASEAAYRRVASLVRTHRQGRLGANEKRSWLGRDGYYLRSTVYNLFLPLAIFRLIQRSTTFVDLKLEPSIHLRYLLLKAAYIVFTDDFVIARELPELKYDPENEDAQLQKENPAVYRKQGLYLGQMERLTEALTVTDGSVLRSKNYGQFEEEAIQSDDKFNEVVDPVMDVLRKFDFLERPILARLLLIYGCIMHLIKFVGDGRKNVNLTEFVEKFFESEEGKALIWWDDDNRETCKIAHAYVARKLTHAIEVSGYGNAPSSAS